MGVFFEIRPVLVANLRGHNLCSERPISKKIIEFSSSLLGLQYGVLRSVIYFGPKLSIF